VSRGQESVVRVAQIGADYIATPPKVTFRVYWDTAPSGQHLDSVWLFIDYQPIHANGAYGAWTAATLNAPALASGSEGTIATVPSNTRGFYLYGNPAGSFSATITVGLTGVPSNTRFNWCTYASDYPPNATDNNGYYDLHGSPPFVVNGVRLAAGVATYSGCITSLTDTTGCPGLIPPSPEITSFTASISTICAGDSLTLTATATGASSYSFDGGASWITATTSATTRIAPQQDTSCNVSVRNAGGCIKTANTTVTVLPSPTLSVTSAPTNVCAGSEVTVIVAGGESYCFTHSCSECIHNPYHNGNGDPSEAECEFENLSCNYTASNNYTFTMPDSGSVTIYVKAINASGCTDSLSVVCVGWPLPPVPALPAAATYCHPNTAISCTGLGGYTYQLLDGGHSPVGGMQDGTGGTLYFNVTAAGKYYIFVLDETSHCTSESNQQEVTLYTALDAGAISGSDTATAGNTATTATIAAGTPASGASGAYTYRWVRENPAATFTTNTASYIFTASELATSGTYTYYREVRDNACDTDTWKRAAGEYSLTVESCPYTGADLYQNATHPCQKRSSGAQNWEAWIKDSRDNTIYRIAMLSTNNFWTMDDYLAYASHSAVIAVSKCDDHDATGKEYWKDVLATSSNSLCPAGWRLPDQSEFESTIDAWAQYLTKAFVPTGETEFHDSNSNCLFVGSAEHTAYVVSDCLGTRKAGQRVVSISPVLYMYDSHGDCISISSEDGKSSGYVRCVRSM
jgi:uncharacterized protein (TIGR02145 family)